MKNYIYLLAILLTVACNNSEKKKTEAAGLPPQVAAPDQRPAPENEVNSYTLTVEIENPEVSGDEIEGIYNMIEDVGATVMNHTSIEVGNTILFSAFIEATFSQSEDLAVEYGEEAITQVAETEEGEGSRSVYTVTFAAAEENTEEELQTDLNLIRDTEAQLLGHYSSGADYVALVLATFSQSEDLAVEFGEDNVERVLAPFQRIEQRVELDQN